MSTKVLDVSDLTPPNQESAAEGGVSAPPSEEQDTVLESGEFNPLADLEGNANKLIDDPNYDPLAGPAALFSLYSGRIMGAVEKLSSKQKSRLLKALICYPLENVEINKKNELEWEVYKIASKVLESKFLMILVTAHQEQEKRRALNEAQKQAAKNAEEAKEVSSVEQTTIELKQNTDNKENNNV